MNEFVRSLSHLSLERLVNFMANYESCSGGRRKICLVPENGVLLLKWKDIAKDPG